MANTVIAEPGGSPQAVLAAQHGLGVAGARPKLGVYIRKAWEYRHFTTTFADAGIAASLKHARLGRFWQVLTPLANAGVYYLIFGVIIGTRGRVDNYIAYLCIGIFLFTFTSSALQQGVQAITKNVGLVRALQFPRACLPISSTLAQFQNLLASMLVLLAIVLLTGEPIRWQWLILLPALALQTLFNAGFAMIFARIGNKITDLKQVLPFVLRTWMYSSGIMYSATTFSEHLPAALAKVALTNPLLVYVELARHALLVHEPMVMSWPRLWFLGILWAAVMSIAGFVYFWLGEREYGRG